MKLTELVVDVKTVWLKYEGVPGFEVQVNYIPRTEMTKMVKDCQTSKMNRKTRSVEMELDDEKFLKKFVRRAISNWKGLTTENVGNFLPIKETEEKGEIEFSEEAAIYLVKESGEFDEWLNEKITDIDSFR